jgi:hypothetical protein
MQDNLSTQCCLCSYARLVYSNLRGLTTSKKNDTHQSHPACTRAALYSLASHRNERKCWRGKDMLCRVYVRPPPRLLHFYQVLRQ